MPLPLTWKMEREGGSSRAVLSGEFSEDADFASLLAMATNPLELDLAGIERVTSCGVREWLIFMKAAEKQGRRIVLERCSPVIVQQANMISNFLGACEVRSVQLPYFCDSCRKERTLLRELGGKPPEPPEKTATCPDCGGQMEFDDLAGTYFEFLHV